MGNNQIIPTAIAYQTQLITNVKGLKDLFEGQEYEKMASARIDLIRTISDHVSTIKQRIKDMNLKRGECNKMRDVHQKAFAYDKYVRPFLDEIRTEIDQLELIIDNEQWPIPKYREMLFHR